MAADAIGDAISGLGVAVPEGTTLLEMAELIAQNLFVKTEMSYIALKTSQMNNVQTANVGLTNNGSSGTAFRLVGRTVEVLYAVDVQINVKILAGATNGKLTVNLQKNGTTVKTSSFSAGSQPGQGNISISYSEKAIAGTKYSLQYVSNDIDTVIYAGTMTLNGTK